MLQSVGGQRLIEVQDYGPVAIKSQHVRIKFAKGIDQLRAAIEEDEILFRCLWFPVNAYGAATFHQITGFVPFQCFFVVT